jgi:hypothetical protein
MGWEAIGEFVVEGLLEGLTELPFRSGGRKRKGRKERRRPWRPLLLVLIVIAVTLTILFAC